MFFRNKTKEVNDLLSLELLSFFSQVSETIVTSEASSSVVYRINLSMNDPARPVVTLLRGSYLRECGSDFHTVFT